ncbi:MAG: hypothetical protein ACXABY_14865 [Candidatus Thorarchaeota archaeon]|jgi:hypothetical protein
MNKFFILFLVPIILTAGCVTDDNNGDENNETGYGDGDEDCQQEKFTSPPADLDEIVYILPMGGTHGDHIAPVDHIYFIREDDMVQVAEPIEVYSPEDGTITNIQHMGGFVSDYDVVFDDYHITISHACGLKSIFIHADELSSKLTALAPAAGGSTSVNIPVSAGEVIAYYTGSLDYLVIDQQITNNLIPDSYSIDPERLHIQDPFLYFEDTIEARLIELSIRTVEPIGGLIDYDVDGTLLGTWFKEGTNGWAGLDAARYWADHLAIVYDELDPDHVVISIGTFKDVGAQFGVKGNSPDPVEVTTDSGMIEYELLTYDHFDGDIRWNNKYLAKGVEARSYEDTESGVILLELIEDRMLKVEIIPDMTADQVDGFTQNAEIYVR